jgi:hypothetical protein
MGRYNTSQDICGHSESSRNLHFILQMTNLGIKKNRPIKEQHTNSYFVQVV